MVRHSVTINQKKSYWRIIWRSPESLKPSQLGSQRVRAVILLRLVLSVIDWKIRNDGYAYRGCFMWALVSKEGLCCRIIRNRKMCWRWWWTYTRKISLNGILKHCQTQHYRHMCVLMDQSVSWGFGTNGKTTMNLTHMAGKRKKMELYKYFLGADIHLQDLCWDLLDVLKWLTNILYC